MSSWCPVTFSSGSSAPDFICLLNTVMSIAVDRYSPRSREQSCYHSSQCSCQRSCLFPQHDRFLFKDSVSQRFDTRYFTLFPGEVVRGFVAISPAEFFSSVEQDLFSYSMFDWVGISVYFNHLFLSIVCRVFVAAVSPVEHSFNPDMVG